MKKIFFLLLLISNISVGQIVNMSRIRNATASLTVTPTTLTGFTTSIGVASDAQTFTISGTLLTTDVELSVSGSFEFSIDGGSVWVTSEDYSVSGGGIVSQPVTVHARISAAAAGTAGAKSGTISITTTGASSSVTLSGTVETPTINVNPTSLTGYSTITGTASGYQTFAVDADNLVADVTVTAPTDFEVSTSSGSGYGASVTLGRTGTNLTSEPVTIYARIKSSATVGAKSGNITNTSTSATTQNVAVTGDVESTGVSQRILIDFGGYGVTNSSGQQTYSPQGGNYWNNESNIFSASTFLSNPVDIANATVTGFSIATDKKPGGTFAPADSSMNGSGYTTAVSDYPSTAVSDNVYFHSSAGVVTWTFTIPSGKQASIKFWGGRNTTGAARILQIKRSTDGSYTQEFESLGNQTYSQGVTFTGVAGTAIFNMQVKSGSTFGHISVIDITLTDL
jgi:hypothetical protein